MNGHLILGWILRFSNSWEWHFCQCLSMNRQCILNLTRTMHQEGCSFPNKREMKMHSPVRLFPNRWCDFVFILAGLSFEVVANQVFADPVEIFRMCAEQDNEERTEMQLNFRDSQNPTVFITTPRVGWTGLYLTPANHTAITQKFWELNEQWLEILHVVLGVQNGVHYTGLPNTGPGGYDNRPSNLHQHSRVAWMRVLQGLMNWPNITMSIIHLNLLAHEDYTQWLT